MTKELEINRPATTLEATGFCVVILLVLMLISTSGCATHPGYSSDWETGTYLPDDYAAYSKYMADHPELKHAGGFPDYRK